MFIEHMPFSMLDTEAIKTKFDLLGHNLFSRLLKCIQISRWTFIVVFAELNNQVKVKKLLKPYRSMPTERRLNLGK